MLIRWLSVRAIFNLYPKLYSISPSSVLCRVKLVIIVTKEIKTVKEQVIRLATLSVFNFLGIDMSNIININKVKQVVLPWKSFPKYFGAFSIPKISISKTGKVFLNKHK